MPPRALTTTARRVALAGMATGAAVAAYGAGYEVRAFTVRHVEVPVLPAGAAPLRVLHLSDLHLTPAQRAKGDWIRSLARLEPDFVVDTGDNLAHHDSVPVLLDSMGPLLGRPGAFVLGSNDYFAPSFRNPVRYLLPDDGRRSTHTARLPYGELRRALTGAGWLDLTNTRGRVTVGGLDVALVGVDDPHLRYDDLAAVAGPAPAEADLRIGVTHAPYLRVLDQFATDGYEVVLAGHTHGGQICLPGGRALITNCDLEPARARGLSRHPAGSAPGQPGSAWLHVSAGAGTSPYAPVRIACRPEATLLTLVAA